MSDVTIQICCACNKIQQNENCWDYNIPANFVSATLTYGLCPKCMKEMYPVEKENRSPNPFAGMKEAYGLS